MLEREHLNLDADDAKCLEEYYKEVEGQPVRKNLLRMITHVNFLNPLPTKNSWEYIFWNRMLTDEMVDFVLKMKLISLPANAPLDQMTNFLVAPL